MPDEADEISASPESMKCIDLRGAIVTIDAIGGQKTVAEQIVKAQADYVLALKDSHRAPHADAVLWLDSEVENGRLAIQETTEKGHGWGASLQLEYGPGLAERPSGLGGTGRDRPGRAIRQVSGKQSRECRYFLSSVTDPQVFAHGVREHWAIENA